MLKLGKVRGAAATGVTLLLSLAFVSFVATPSHAAVDRYSIQFKAWIPQAQVTAIEAGMKLDRFCQSGVFSTNYFNGNNHRDYRGNDADDHKASITYDFTWDGSKMADLSPPKISYGRSYMTMRNYITGSSCTVSDQVSSDAGVSALSARGARLWMSTGNPFYYSAPKIDGTLDLSFTDSNKLVVDTKTDRFPSYGYEVTKNGARVATVRSYDAWCVDTDGPDGALALNNGLTAGEAGLWMKMRQTIDTRAVGMTYSQPCDANYTAAPLPYPAPRQYLPGQPTTPPNVPAQPGNVPPTAAFIWSRQTGANNIVALNGRSSSDRDGTVSSWQWYVGSNRIATGPSPVVALGAGTSKTVTLVVTDNAGATGRVAKTLSLPNRGPVITEVAPQNGTVAGTNTPVLSAVASDADGGALQYVYRVTGPSLDVSSDWLSGAWQVPPHRLDPGVTYSWSVTARDAAGATSSRTSTFAVAMLPTAADVISTPDSAGYWQVDTRGTVSAFGDAQNYGSLSSVGVTIDNVMGMARTPSGLGYWIVARDGGVFCFGDAQFYGSLPGQGTRVSNIVGMVPTRSGAGYWLAGSDGGVFSFGDAQFYGSKGGQPLNAPVKAISATQSGAGYWLVAADGGVFTFGDAPFYGSLGDQHLNAPVVDMDLTPDGGGYWLTAEDGGVFTFGNAQFYGSLASQHLNGHVTGMSATRTGAGYWLTGCDGGVFAFGDATFNGSNPTYQCRGT